MQTSDTVKIIDRLAAATWHGLHACLAGAQQIDAPFLELREQLLEAARKLFATLPPVPCLRFAQLLLETGGIGEDAVWGAALGCMACLSQDEACAASPYLIPDRRLLSSATAPANHTIHVLNRCGVKSLHGASDVS